MAVDTARFTTALHHLVLVPPSRARGLLRAGADIHAANAPGAPTPLSLARELAASGGAPEGSTAWLVLHAADPWTRVSHELFPTASRARAVSLAVSLAHLHARRMGAGSLEAQDFVDAVLAFVITRA